MNNLERLIPVNDIVDEIVGRTISSFQRPEIREKIDIDIVQPISNKLKKNLTVVIIIFFILYALLITLLIIILITIIKINKRTKACGSSVKKSENTNNSKSK
jgi:hypothetical protein